MLDLPALVTSARQELGIPERATPVDPSEDGPALAQGLVRGVLGTSLGSVALPNLASRTLMASRAQLPAVATAPSRFVRPVHGSTFTRPDQLAPSPISPRSDAVRRTVESMGSDFRPAMQALVDVAHGSTTVLGATTSARLVRTEAAAQLASMYVDGISHGEHAMPRSPRIDGNKVDLLVRDAEYLPRLYRDLRGARQSITINQFNWEPDGSGAIVADILRQKARQGVDVRIIHDGLGSKEKGRKSADDFRRSMEQAGVKYLKTESLKPGGTGHEHRKIITVDDRISFTGGIGFGKKYDTWTDLMVRMEGPAAAVAAGRQLATYRTLTGAVDDRMRGRIRSIGTTLQAASRGAARLEDRAPTSGPLADTRAAVTLLFNDPGRDLAASEAFLRDAAAAKRRLWVTSTYLTTTPAKLALIDAAKRGVDVRLMMSGPRSGNDKFQILLGHTQYADLLDAGVKVYQNPTILHCKSWMRDDDVAAVGSMNLSRSSMARAREVTARVEDPGFATAYASFYAQTLPGTEPLDRRDTQTVKVRVAGLLRKVGLEF